MLRTRGATMIEMLITTAVLAVVGSLSILLLSRTGRVTQRGTLMVEMQEQAQVALTRISDDMRRSCCEGVSTRSAAQPHALCICPTSRPDLRPGEPPPVKSEDGSLRWSSFFQFYYHDNQSQELRYREWPNGSVDAIGEETNIAKPRRLSPDRIRDILDGTGSNERRLATGVVAMNLIYPSGGGDGFYVQPLTIELKLERQGAIDSPNPERFTLSKSVFLTQQK